MSETSKDFFIRHFAFDGELLDSAWMEGKRLSPKWLNMTSGLLHAGPNFTQRLDGPLCMYEIKCTAGICHFTIKDAPAFFGVLLTPRPESQNQQLLDVFCKKLETTPLIVNGCSDIPRFMGEIRESVERPAFIVVNWLNPEVPESAGGAMFELAYHFASSYFRWRENV